MGAIKDYFNRKWEEKNNDPNRSVGMTEGVQKTEDRYKEGGDLYRSGLGEGGGEGKTTVAGTEVKTAPKKKGSTQFSITGKSGKVYNYDSFSDFSKEYQQNDDFNAETAMNAIDAYSGGNKKNAENLFSQLYGGKLSDFAQDALDKYKNADLYEAQRKSEAASASRQKDAENATDELLNKGREAMGKSGLQNEKDQERYNRILEAADKLFEKNVDPKYIDNIVRGRTIWGNYGVVKDQAMKEGYSEEEAKKIARRNLGVNILQNLVAALGNISNTIKGNGAAPIQTDFDKIKESKLMGALERYNQAQNENMQKDIDAVKAILGNDVNVENSLKQIYANAAIRNAYAKLDQKYKAYVANEMAKRGGNMTAAELMNLTKAAFIDQGIDGKLADEALGAVKGAAGGVMDLIK